MSFIGRAGLQEAFSFIFFCAVEGFSFIAKTKEHVAGYAILHLHFLIIKCVLSHSILSYYISAAMAPYCFKQIGTDLKGEVDSNAVILGEP